MTFVGIWAELAVGTMFYDFARFSYELLFGFYGGCDV